MFICLPNASPVVHTYKTQTGYYEFAIIVAENKKRHMEKRKCGNSDMMLSCLGVGCWAFGGGEYWGDQNQKDVDEVVHRAVDLGINFFDTAEAYNKGTSESSLGLALKGIPRDKVFVGTKISPSNVQPENVEIHLDASLKRLQLDYVDLYMVHWPITAHSIKHFSTGTIPTPSVQVAFDTLRKMQEKGKIRNIGVSNFGPEKMDEALATGANIVINELPYSLLTRAIELEILPYCRNKGIGVLGYMALMQGLLADIYPTLDDVPLWQRRTRHFDVARTPEHCRHGLPGAEAETDAAINAVRAIAKKYGMTTPEISLKWAIAGNGLTCSLAGSRNVKELEANAKAANEPLPAEVIAELSKATDDLLKALGTSFDYYENPKNDRTK